MAAVRKKTAEFSTLSNLLEIWYLGYVRCPQNDGDDRIFRRTKFRNMAEFSTLSDWLEIWYIGYMRYPEHDDANEIFL